MSKPYREDDGITWVDRASHIQLFELEQIWKSGTDAHPPSVVEPFDRYVTEEDDTHPDFRHLEAP